MDLKLAATSLKRRDTWNISLWKDIPRHRAASAISKLRLEWDALKIYQNVQIPEFSQRQMLVMIQSSKASHSYLMGPRWSDKHWKTVWQYHTKLKLLFTTSCYIPWVYTKEMKLKSTQNLPINVYRSFTNACQNLELIRIYFTRWMG